LGQQLDKSDKAQAAKAQRKAHIVPVGRTPKPAIISGDTRQLSILVAIQKKPMVKHAANLTVPGRFKVVRF
jgi:hypothetical protein